MVRRSILPRVFVSSRPGGFRLLGIALGALFTSVPAGAGVGDDRVYVMPDGQRVPLSKSADEYGVVLHSCDDAEACAKRLSAEGQGTLESFKWAPHARVKLLRVRETSAARKTAIRKDRAVQDVRPIYRFEGWDAPAVSTGTIAAKLRPDVSDADRVQLWAAHGVAKAEPVFGQPLVFRLTPVGEDDDEVLLAEVLSRDARVLWAQPNFRRAVVTRQVTPLDPLYRLQWHLNNTGQAGGTVGADIDVLEAWSATGGENVLIGMFDDSCDVDHEDLRDNYSGIGHDATLEFNAEGADDPRPKEFGDRHGTAVMGLAAARSNNLGGRGVAHLAKFTASRGLTDLISEVEVARVFTFARQENVDVHINSWGFFGPDPAVVVDSLDLAFREGRNKGDLDGDGDDDPLGMVIVFASGNQGSLLQPGFELAMLPQVIGVGASNDEDERASYSNYGTGIDVIAPGGDLFGALLLVTTDNTDSSGNIDHGYNVGGLAADQFNVLEVEPTGAYTGFFNGTSAACPIAAGVAALVLSVNPMLSATDVRLILEHTADKVSPTDAAYNNVTSRSLTYGYGRINAGSAVTAAQETLTNGGRTWPDRPGDLSIEGLSIRWTQNIGTDEFLVVQSENEFEFIPVDGECYADGQLGCAGASLRPLPAGVDVLKSGCRLTCSDSEIPSCDAGDAQCVNFNVPAQGKKWFFGVFARSVIGRYSHGVAADSNGLVTDSGDVVGGGDPGGSTIPPGGGPAVNISVSPLEGDSPLTVAFNGNAVSAVAIDESRTAWDFNVNDSDTSPDATTRSASHTYVVASQVIRTFVARLTMYDIEGRAGWSEVAIRVQGSADGDSDDTESTGDVRIIVGVPGTPGSDVDGGTSPFSVKLSVDASKMTGTLQSVVWDLGDGTRWSSLEVSHTYINETQVAWRLPITATVTTVSGATTLNTSATRIISIQPGSADADPDDPDLPGTTPGGDGGAATPCSGVGMLPLIFMLTSLLWLRRRI